MRHLVIGILALISSACAHVETAYPELELANEVITVLMYLPDAENGFYRGTRFDWSGIVKRVEYAGHHFYGPLHADHDPTGHDFVSGPAEEFGMYHPMGFAEADAGESFVKIGVGLLRKNPSDEYLFHGQYEIVRAGKWQIDHGPDWVDFRQELDGKNGWAYRYLKRIELVPGRPEFTIFHRLENTGSKTIDIDNYNHNFNIIDGLPYGPDYSVEFPFSVDQPKPINDLAWFRGNGIEVEQPLQDNSLWIQVLEGGGPAEYNSAIVRNEKTGASIAFKGDAPITHFIFWAVEQAACPEPFISVNIAPGEVQEWTSHYTFATDAARR